MKEPSPPLLTASVERWQRQLRQAQDFLPADPMSALARARSAAQGIDDAIARHPGANTELASLAVDARLMLDRTQDASVRWLDQCADRERRFRDREKRSNHLPL